MMSRQSVIVLALTLPLLQFANAETTTGHASVNILDTLEITETKIVDFGAISGSDGICSMSGPGVLSGSQGSTCQGTGQVGSFLISGSAGQSVNISVNSASGPQGLSFEPALLSGPNQTLANGSTTALIGGQLALNDAPRGSQMLTYFITVNYN